MLKLNKLACDIKSHITTGQSLYQKRLASSNKRSILGDVWTLIEPGAMATVFIILYSFKVLPVNDIGMEYGFFVVSGFLVWQLFNDSLIESLGILRSSENILRHLKISPFSLIISVMFQRMRYVMVYFLILIVVILAYYDLSRIHFSLLFFLVGTLISLLVIVIGLAIAPFYWFLEDLEKLIRISLRPLMFGSGIVFPLSNSGLDFISTINPINIIVDWHRSFYSFHENTSPFLDKSIYFSASLCFLSLVLGCYCVQKTTRYVISE